MPVIKTGDVLDDFGHGIVAVAPLGGTMKTFVSPNMCDKSSWWYDSVQVTEEVMSTSDDLTYTAVNGDWVNLDNIVDSHEIPEKGVTVLVDDVEQTSGFTINHVAGSVTFALAQTGSTVKVSYSHGGTPTWEITPTEGKVLRVSMAEVQVSMDFVFNADILFEILVQVGPDSWMVAGQNRYKNARDLISRANRGYTVPAIAELTQDVLVMPFEYPAVIDLEYEMEGSPLTPAMKLRVRLSDNVEMGGELGTVALYCLSETV